MQPDYIQSQDANSHPKMQITQYAKKKTKKKKLTDVESEMENKLIAAVSFPTGKLRAWRKVNEESGLPGWKETLVSKWR